MTGHSSSGPAFDRRAFLKGGAAASALGTLGTLGALGGPLGATDGAADMIVTGGKIFTGDPWQPFVEALAVKAGRIVATGSDSDITAYRARGTRVVAAGGRTVIPGLNDSHLHAVRGGRFYATELRWDGLTSLARGLDMIAEAARRTPKGQWIRVVGGWSPYQFAEKRMPSPEELTRAAPGTPVFVMLLYSQGLMNRAGLDALGITPETRAPKGTRYEVGADGTLTGRLLCEPYPNILYQTIGQLPPLGAEEQAVSTRHWYHELNRFGLTSVIDAGGGGHLFPRDYGGSQALAAAGPMPLRVSYFLFPQRPGHELEDFQAWGRDYEVGGNSARTVNGFVLEGGGELLAFKASDYENFLAERPDFTQTDGWDTDLYEVVQYLVANRWPLRIHATYDQSIRAMLDVFERLHRDEILAGRPGFTGLRWAFDHAETVQPDTVRRLKRLDGSVALQGRMAYGGEFFMERYGRTATLNSPPIGTLLKEGVPIGLGTDGTRVASYHPWSTLYWATTGRSVGGTEVLGAEHRLSRAHALALYTRGSAYFSGEEHLKGRLVPGQYADFAILSEDYFTVEDARIRAIEAVLTVTDGAPVYGAGPFAELNPDLPALIPDWSPVHTHGGFQNDLAAGK